MSTPRQGIHALRLFDIAIVDVLFTILAAVLISRKHFVVAFFMLMVLSVTVHTLLGIETKTNGWWLSKKTGE